MIVIIELSNFLEFLIREGILVHSRCVWNCKSSKGCRIFKVRDVALLLMVTLMVHNVILYRRGGA